MIDETDEKSPDFWGIYLQEEIANFSPQYLVPSELPTLVAAVSELRTNNYKGEVRIIGSRLENKHLSTQGWLGMQNRLGIPVSIANATYRVLNEFVILNQLDRSQWQEVCNFASRSHVPQSILDYLQDRETEIFSDVDLLVANRPNTMNPIYDSAELVIDIFDSRGMSEWAC